MKRYFISILFVLIIFNFSHCQVPNNASKTKQINCIANGTRTEESLFKELRYFRKDNLVSVIIQQEIQCAKSTLTTKNINDLVGIIDRKYERSFKDMKKNETTINDCVLFVHLGTFLKEIGTESAIEVLMKFFSVNESLSELLKDYGDSVDAHLGLNIFKQHILPLMHPSQEAYYKKLYDDLFLSLVIESKLQYTFNPLHEKLYPIIKQDWESGKLKLKTVDSNQEKK